MWSVGVIIYVLLCGYPPFVDENQSALFQKIRVGEWKFHDSAWKDISKEAKSLIKKLLVVNPRQRWTAKECLKSAWMTKEFVDETADLTQSVAALRLRKSQLRGGLSKGMWGNSKVEQPPSRSMDEVEMLLSRREVEDDDDDEHVQHVKSEGDRVDRFMI